MGGKGPPPKPTKLRLIEGTDRKGRSGRQLDASKEPVAPEGDMAPPYDLADEVRQVWDVAAKTLDTMQLASPADANQLAAYCEAVVLHRRASRAIADTDLLVDGVDVKVINKAILIQDRAARLIRGFAQEFGLTPAARVRVEVDPHGGSVPSSSMGGGGFFS